MTPRDWLMMGLGAAIVTAIVALTLIVIGRETNRGLWGVTLDAKGWLP